MTVRPAPAGSCRARLPGHRDLPPSAVPRVAVPLFPRLMRGHPGLQTGAPHDTAHDRPARGAPGVNSANSVNHVRVIPTRERSPVKRIVYSILAASAAAAVISGCSASEIVNTGGDTKCKDYLTQDEKKQNDEVSKMLKDKSGQDPTNPEITATKTSVALYCQALGKEDTKISEAPHG